MPKEYDIINGPPFKSFVFNSHALAQSRDIISFTFGRGERKPASEAFSVLMIGTPFMTGEEDKDEKDHNFIGLSHSYGPLSVTYPGQEQSCLWIIGQYNPQTRKGKCLLIRPDEVRSESLLYVLFPGVFKHLRLPASPCVV